MTVLASHFTGNAATISGPIHLESWSSKKAGGGRFTFDAAFSIRDVDIACAATTYGPIEALTTMLFDAGFRIEILSFHQQSIGADTATFVCVDHNGQNEWSMAIERDPALSSVRAVVNGANLLHG